MRPAPRLETTIPDTVETITPAGEEDPVGVFGGAHGGRRVMFVLGELARRRRTSSAQLNVTRAIRAAAAGLARASRPAGT